MRILLSNDDGYQARGLRTLAEHLKAVAEVVVVAPDRNRSGASNSLTLETPLRVERVDDNLYYVNGTPTDCVHIAITGRTSGTDFVMIDLTFDGLENAIGLHRVEFSLPEGGEHVANSSLDDTWYYSQGGVIDVSVEADGSISGSFDIALAQGTLGAPGEPVVFAPSEVAKPLVGSFSGDWVLNCHSRLRGHSTLIFGGEYCDNLEF